MIPPTFATFDCCVVRNVQAGSVKVKGEALLFNEYMARHAAPFQMGSNNFRRGLATAVAPVSKLVNVVIPLTPETENEYTVDKYSSLVDVLKAVTNSSDE